MGSFSVELVGKAAAGGAACGILFGLSNAMHGNGHDVDVRAAAERIGIGSAIGLSLGAVVGSIVGAVSPLHGASRLASAGYVALISAAGFGTFALASQGLTELLGAEMS